MEKLIITAAITGASTIPSLSPYLPIPPKQIADSAIEAVEAGAAEINLSTMAFIWVGMLGLDWETIFISRRGY